VVVEVAVSPMVVAVRLSLLANKQLLAPIIVATPVLRQGPLVVVEVAVSPMVVAVRLSLLANKQLLAPIIVATPVLRQGPLVVVEKNHPLPLLRHHLHHRAEEPPVTPHLPQISSMCASSVARLLPPPQYLL
jgi:hypothetical protein